MRFFTVDEVATTLRTTRDAIYRRIRRGTLPVVRDGRRVLVPVSAIEAIIGTDDRHQADGNPRAGLRGLSPEPRMENQTNTGTRTECLSEKNFFSILPCKKGKAKWVVNFYLHEPGRKRPREARHRSPYDSKAETRRWATQRLAELSAKAPAPPASGVTVTTTCERWLATQDSDLTNKRRYTKWLRLAWGDDTMIDALTHERIVGLGAILRQPLGPRASEQSRARRPKREGRPRHRKGDGLSPASIRAVCQTANRILTFAAHMGWRLTARVPLPKVPLPDAAWLTIHELRTLVDHAGPWRLGILLGARAGLRRGEIVELRWDDVDLPNRRIRVARAFRKNDAGEWVVAACKGKEARTVTIPTDLVAALREVEGKRGDLVVSMEGKRVVPWVFTETLPIILKAAGIYRPGLGVHALRHTYCSHLAQGGAPAIAIQALAGHKSLATTMRYMHLSPLHVSQAVAALPPF